MLVAIVASLRLDIPAQSSLRAATAEVGCRFARRRLHRGAQLPGERGGADLPRRSASKLQPAPFPKEPALPGQNVFRGSLLWGPRAEQAMSFIWDKGRGRLFLDLNRNRDLTDDPKGIFDSASRDGNQTFDNVHLVLPTATGNRATGCNCDSIPIRRAVWAFPRGSARIGRRG